MQLLCLNHLGDLTPSDKESLSLFNKHIMVEFLTIGRLFDANKIFQAAFKMTKANMKWLVCQVRQSGDVKEPKSKNKI